MKLLLATAFCFTATAIAQQGLPPELTSDIKIKQSKQDANQFLHTRAALSAMHINNPFHNSNKPWEWKETPWENIREYVHKNKRLLGLHSSDLELVESCTEEYREDWEDYDEAMENSLTVQLPKYDCVETDKPLNSWGTKH